MKYPDKLKTLNVYQPIEEAYSVRMDANESFVKIPDWLGEKISRALAGVELNRYPDPMAKEVCALAAKRWNVGQKNVVAGCGSDELINVLLGRIVPAGGKVLVSDPDFSMYRFYAGLCELECVSSNRSGGGIDVDNMIGLAQSAQMIIFSNPCNPTGQGLPASEVIRLLENVSCWVVVDEAYMDFWNESVVDRIESFHHLIVLRTCSKAFGMAGIRLGFAITGGETAALLRSVKSPYNVSALTQAAGAAVLSESGYLDECVANIRAAAGRLNHEVKLLLSGRDDYQVIDTRTNFVLIKTAQAGRIHTLLLEKGISVRYLEGMLRVTAGNDEENARFIAALKEMV